jgi:hypothetical protein
MSAYVRKSSTTEKEKVQLSKYDIGLVLVMCADLVNLCAKLTAKIDPAAGAMLAYLRDEIVAGNEDELDEVRATNLILGNGRASVREPSRLK